MASGIDTYSTTPNSNTSVNGIDIDENCAPSGINNAIRQVVADIRAAFDDIGAKAVSSGTDTITLTTETGYTAYADGTLLAFIAGGTNTTAATLNVDSVGAKAILKGGGTALAAGDIVAGDPVVVAFDASADSSNGAWLYVNKSSLAAILSAIAALSSTGLIARTGSGTVSARTITGTSGKVTVTDGDGVSGNPTLTVGADIKQVGKETIWIPATAMKARTTNGAALGSTEMSTNKNMFVTLDFDTTTQEFAQFEVFFPKSWNLSTVTFQPLWSHAATTTNFGVVWGLAGVARSDDDAGDVAFGTAQTSTDTGGTTNDIYVGPESSAITIAGTPAAGDTVQFQINRTVSDGSDTMAIDARLHGIRLFFTTNAANDT